MNIWIADTETTGLGPSSRAVEIAMLNIDEELNILGEYESLINPGIEISPDASAIHGIYAEDVVLAPTMEQAFDEIRAAGMSTDKVIFIAYNSRFDVGYYKPHIQIEVDFCALKFARTYVKGCTNHKLATIADFLRLPEQRAHAAMGDVRYVYHLLKQTVPLIGRTLVQLIEEGGHPLLLTHMPWGKHVDKPMSKVPKSYLLWLKKTSYDNLDMDMKLTLDHYLKA